MTPMIRKLGNVPMGNPLKREASVDAISRTVKAREEREKRRAEQESVGRVDNRGSDNAGPGTSDSGQQ